MTDDVLVQEAVALFDDYAERFYEAARYEETASEGVELTDDLKDELIERGFLNAGFGDARYVFAVPDELTTTDRDLVVKFPLGPKEYVESGRTDGHQQNRIELERYQDVGVDDQHLAPIYAFDDDARWLVMGYAKPLDPFKDTLEDLEPTLSARIQADAFEYRDIHRNNLGWFEPDEEVDPYDNLTKDGRRLVIVDYGFERGM